MKDKRCEQTAVDEQRTLMSSNLKLRLLQSCIDVNDWDTADEIINGIYGGRLDLTLRKNLLDSMFKAVKWFIAPIIPCKNVS